MVNAIQRQLKIFFLMICYFSNLILGGSDQRHLLKHLITEKQYDPLERPVQNDSQTLPVTINLALQQIINFDGKNEVLTVSGWLVLTWNDYSLAWNPQEFGNITTIRLPSSQIWTPDILLYNCADEKFDSTVKVNAVVQHTGDVLYVPPGIFKSICPFDSATFPFDIQNCKLKFGSWTFDDAGINLTAESDKGQLDAYIKSAEWDLEDFSATSHALKYDCCPTLYPYVLFNIRIRRRSLYYVTNIVVPCFLISCMTLLGFLLAPDSGEKLTLQITILLTIVMFSLLMSEIMPPTSTAVPIITVYFMCVMTMSTLSVVAAVFVISLHFRTAKNFTMPVWVHKYVCHYLAWLLFMKRPGHDLTWRGIRRHWALAKEHPNNINRSIGNHHYKSPSAPLLSNNFESLASNVINVDNLSVEFGNDRDKQRSDSGLEFYSLPGSNIQHSSYYPDLSKGLHSCNTEMIRSELRIIISQIAALAHHTRQQEAYEDESQDWKFVAMVIDRLCLILFTTSMFLFNGLTLFSTPNFYKLQ